jgi:predicted RNA-binding Zn ribbon-like protein
MGWSFDSGDLALDFANTAEWHASDQPADNITSFQDLVSWAQAAGVLSEERAKQLRAHEERNPRKTSRALSRAIRLRELIYRIFSATASNAAPDAVDIEWFNADLSKALSHARISDIDGEFIWEWQAPGSELDQILWPVVRAAADLLTSESLNRVGECADDRGCGYLFIDVSKNHSRRWCSMESCGNRAKARRFYHHQKDQA